MTRERPILFSGPSETDRLLALACPEPNTGCWLWSGATNAKGYGRFRRGEMAHRAALRLLRQTTIPKGLEVDHLCRMRSCVNPDHLDVVSHRENLLRGETVTARAASATHCPQGHAYDTANTYRRRRGSRACRACELARHAADYVPRGTPRRRRPHLTAGERAAILRMVADGSTHQQIASALHVSVGTVSRVRNGK